MKRMIGKYILSSLLALGVVLGIVAQPAIPVLAADTGSHVAFNSSHAAPFIVAPQVFSVVPNWGFPGMQQTVVIYGQNFGFGFALSLPLVDPPTGLWATAVSFGQGITVNNFIVNSPTKITARITILSSALPGFRNVSVSNIHEGMPLPVLTGTLTPVVLTGTLKMGFLVFSLPIPSKSPR
jgi:hypothetical protein